jgi:hypothetical protein
LRIAAIAAGCMACVAAAGARADEGLRELFKDPEDASPRRQPMARGPAWLPAGAARHHRSRRRLRRRLALAFFHGEPDAFAARRPDGRRAAPPSISAGDGSWDRERHPARRRRHLGIWRERHGPLHRFAAAPWTCTSSSTAATDFPQLEDGVAYSLKGWGTLQQGIWRFGQSNSGSAGSSCTSTPTPGSNRRTRRPSSTRWPAGSRTSAQASSLLSTRATTS